MNHTRYSTSMEVPFLPHYIFGRIADLGAWWPEQYIGGPLQPDAEFVFRTGEGHFSKNRVIAFEPDAELAWIATESFRKEDAYDWTGTKFLFELRPEGEYTTVTFTYDGVVMEGEEQRLIRICDATLQEMLLRWLQEPAGGQ